MEPSSLENPEPRKRPTGVLVIAILLFIGAATGLCCGPLGSVWSLVINANNPAMSFVRESTAAMGITICNSVVGFIFGAINLYLALGLLKVKESARKGTVMISILGIIYFVIYMAVYTIVVNPLVMEGVRANIQAQAHAQGRPLPPEAQEMINNITKYSSIGAICGSLCVLAIVLGINGTIIHYLTRPRIKAVFKPPES